MFLCSLVFLVIFGTYVTIIQLMQEKHHQESLQFLKQKVVISNDSAENLITIAILCKDKAHCLPRYLRLLEQQTWLKNHTLLYIRTNDNRDATEKLLKQWVDHVSDRYFKVYYNDTSIDTEVKQFQPHDWNTKRFDLLARVRQDSIEWAYLHNSHYFVADCDNFLLNPNLLKTLYQSQLPIVGPMLNCETRPAYSNYHNVANEYGYFQRNDAYNWIVNRQIKGFIAVDVIHCTYFIRNSHLPYISYLDPLHTGYHEYVLFSNHLRKQRIQQYLDNRQFYGMITFADTQEQLENETWYRTLSQ